MALQYVPTEDYQAHVDSYGGRLLDAPLPFDVYPIITVDGEEKHRFDRVAAGAPHKRFGRTT